MARKTEDNPANRPFQMWTITKADGSTFEITAQEMFLAESDPVLLFMTYSKQSEDADVWQFDTHQIALVRDWSKVELNT